MIKVFKFGGTSIKDVQNIKNISQILKNYAKENLVVVFSAMGKVTNMLEEVVEEYMLKSKNAEQKLQKVKDFHTDILADLFPHEHSIYNEVNNLFVEIEWVLEDEPNLDYAFNYDQIVSLNSIPIGVSTQPVDDLKEMVTRLGVTYDVVSDISLTFAKKLDLPTFIIDDKVFLKRTTLIIEKSVIKKVFYPIFPLNKHINEVMKWLKIN